MSVKGRISLGFAQRHPWQVITAIVGIALGVAVVVAVDLANSAAKSAFESSMQRINGAATHSIVAGSLGVPAATYTLLRTGGFAPRSAPIIEARASLNGKGVTLLGIDPIAELRVRGSNGVGLGADRDAANTKLSRFLTEPALALLSENSAKQQNLAVGDRFDIRIAGQVHEAELLGLAGSGSELDSIVWVDIATAQRWLKSSTRLSRIDLILPEGPSAEAIRALLPNGVELVDAAARGNANREMTRAFMINLTAMSLLAMLVSAFLIYNSLSFAVIQQRMTYATVRALGVSGPGLIRWLLRDALIVGALGFCLGIALGVVLADALVSLVLRSINDLYFTASTAEISLQADTVVRVAAVSLAALLIAILLPASEVWRTPPAQTLQISSLEARVRRVSMWLPIIGLVFAVGTFALLQIAPASLTWGFAALFCALLAACCLIPISADRIIKLLVVATGSLGSAVHIALGDLRARLSRTAPAIMALTIALSASIGVATMVSSFRYSVVDWLDTTLSHDLYGLLPPGANSKSAIATLAKVPGVDYVRGSRRISHRVGGDTLRIQAVDWSAGGDLDLKLVDAIGGAGQIQSVLMTEPAIVISEGFQRETQLGTGEKLNLVTPSGEKAFSIAAVFRSYDVPGADLLMYWPSYAELFDDPYLDVVAFGLSPRASVSEVEQAIEAVTQAAGQTIQLVRNDLIRAETLRIFDRTFEITRVLYWLTLLVAAGGVFAALMALQLENRRQYALLRSLGFYANEVRTLVLTQAVVIGGISALLAAPIGWLVAKLLIGVINERAFGWSMVARVDLSATVFSVLVALTVSIIAGWYPARSAARTWPGQLLRQS